MDNHYEVPIFIAALLVGLGGLVAIFATAGHYNALDLQACYEVVKDKSAADMILICRGSR